MAYLILVLIFIFLLIGALVVTEYESRHAVRFCAHTRARLDEHVVRAMFIATHVDFGTFVHECVTQATRRIAHDCAHLSLVIVRATERLLTRVVRRLRSEHAVPPSPRESTREFVRTLSDFKGQLGSTHPDVPDILA